MAARSSRRLSGPDRDNVGKQSEPEYGISLARSSLPALQRYGWDDTGSERLLSLGLEPQGHTVDLAGSLTWIEVPAPHSAVNPDCAADGLHSVDQSSEAGSR